MVNWVNTCKPSAIKHPLSSAVHACCTVFANLGFPGVGLPVQTGQPSFSNITRFGIQYLFTVTALLHYRSFIHFSFETISVNDVFLNYGCQLLYRLYGGWIIHQSSEYPYQEGFRLLIFAPLVKNRLHVVVVRRLTAELTKHKVEELQWSQRSYNTNKHRIERFIPKPYL